MPERKRFFGPWMVFIVCMILSSCNSYIEQTEPEKSEPTPSVARPRQFRILGAPDNITSSEIILLASETEVSRTGIRFQVENQSTINFHYSYPWELAQFVDERWNPAPFLPGIDSTSFVFPLIKHLLLAEETNESNINWDWLFGELPPGRYMFIRYYDSPELGPVYQWPREGREFLTVEFVIDEYTPAALPPRN